eukprot:5250329-Pyramimonas_sp.AAC.1
MFSAGRERGLAELVVLPHGLPGAELGVREVARVAPLTLARGTSTSCPGLANLRASPPPPANASFAK